MKRRKKKSGRSPREVHGSCRMWRISLRDMIYGTPIYMCFEWLIWKLHAILASRWCRLLGRLRTLAWPGLHLPRRTNGLHQSTSVYMTRLYAARTAAKARDVSRKPRHSTARFSAKSWFSVLATHVFCRLLTFPEGACTFRDLQSAWSKFILSKQ